MSTKLTSLYARSQILIDFGWLTDALLAVELSHSDTYQEVILCKEYLRFFQDSVDFSETKMRIKRLNADFHNSQTA
jgi:hypothetical protein